MVARPAHRTSRKPNFGVSRLRLARDRRIDAVCPASEFGMERRRPVGQEGRECGPARTSVPSWLPRGHTDVARDVPLVTAPSLRAANPAPARSRRWRCQGRFRAGLEPDRDRIESGQSSVL